MALNLLQRWPEADVLQAAAQLRNAARKITIFGDAGVEGAHEEGLAVAKKLEAPVAHAPRGKPFIEYDSPATRARPARSA